MNVKNTTLLPTFYSLVYCQNIECLMLYFFFFPYMNLFISYTFMNIYIFSYFILFFSIFIFLKENKNPAIHDMVHESVRLDLLNDM